MKPATSMCGAATRAALSLVANYTYAKNLIDAPDFRSPAVYDVPQIHGKSRVRALSRNLPRPRHLHSATRAGIPYMVRVCTLDLAVVRSFVLTESLKLEMLAEGFNALNHSNLGTPNRFVNTPQFGTITEASTPGRQIQLSARISF